MWIMLNSKIYEMRGWFVMFVCLYVMLHCIDPSGLIPNFWICTDYILHKNLKCVIRDYGQKVSFIICKCKWKNLGLRCVVSTNVSFPVSFGLSGCQCLKSGNGHGLVIRLSIDTFFYVDIILCFYADLFCYS